MSLGSTAPLLPAFIYLTAYLGPGDSSNQKVLQYQSGQSLQASVTTSFPFQLAESEANFEIDLGTYFSTAAPLTPIFICLSDTTTPGVGFTMSTVSGTNPIPFGPNGVFVIIPGTSVPLPTLYVTNPSATSILNLNLGAISQ